MKNFPIVTIPKTIGRFCLIDDQGVCCAIGILGKTVGLNLSSYGVLYKTLEFNYGISQQLLGDLMRKNDESSSNMDRQQLLRDFCTEHNIPFKEEV